jgi:hypothetical protein
LIPDPDFSPSLIPDLATTDRVEREKCVVPDPQHRKESKLTYNQPFVDNFPGATAKTVN